MPRLSKEDIAFIHRQLKERGLGYSPLREELVDHVCCEVEVLVNQGTPFKLAVQKILEQVREDQLLDVQDHTIQSDNASFFMLAKNNGKIMWRNMIKYKGYMAINVAGLALGLLCFTVIALYVHHELTFDHQFSRFSSIYRVTMSSEVGGSSNHIPTSYPTVGPLLREKFAGVSDYVRIINYKYSRLSPTFRLDDKIFYEDGVIFADSSFFRIFDFTFLAGNPQKALTNPGSVVLTASMAKKYFGDEDVLGRHLNFNNKADLEVTGVVADLPSNTHLKFDFVLPMTGLGNSLAYNSLQLQDNWSWDWFWTYLIIEDKNAVTQIESDLNTLVKEKVKDFSQARFYLQSLGDVHLHSNFDYGTDITPVGDINNLYIFISVAGLVLLISCINFVNISIATASGRYKEIGISKVLGAMKSQLRLQFVGESVVIAVFSLVLGLLLLQITLPLFSILLGVTLKLDFARHAYLLIGIVGSAILVGIVSGLYPAFFVSSFDPQRVLKGVWKAGTGGARFRSALVALQVSISIFLIVGTLVVYRQLQFVQQRNLGYDKEHLIMLQVKGTAIRNKYYAFKQSLLGQSGIAGVTSVSEPIGREVQFMAFKVDGKAEDQFVKILNVGYDFTETMGLTMASGRDFSRDVISDSSAGFLINEAAARHYGWTDPVGKNIRHAFWAEAPQGQVIGVVKDFNFEPLHAAIDPLVIFKGLPAWYVAVRIKPGDTRGSLAKIEQAWRQFEPDKPFNFHFLDQSIQNVYANDERVSNVFFVFAVLSIFTAALGLFGLVSFVAQQRLAEIGLRKVLGASVSHILLIMTKSYFILVLAAFVLATPFTYLIMERWLESFAFRIDFNAFYFVAALAAALAIVLGTVMARAWRAAQTNPVDVLRNE